MSRHNFLYATEKQAIHREVVARYKERRERLNAALEGALAATDTDIYSRAASLSALLSELCPEEEAHPLGAELPNRIVEKDPVPPTLGANICPAYLAGTPGLAPSSLPVEPSEEDLAPTLDAPPQRGLIRRLYRSSGEAYSLLDSS